MPDKKNPNKPSPVFGWILITAGFYPLLAAVGLLPSSNSPTNGPPIVVAVCGIIFILGGVMILLGQKSRYTPLFAALVCACLAFISGWVAFFAPEEGFSGGIPFLPRSVNIRTGRILFGFGSLFTLIFSIYALRQFIMNKKK